MKNVFKLIGIFALSALIGFSLTSCEDLLGALGGENGGENGGETEYDITITNNTGYKVTLLQVVPSTDSNWGGDKLAANELLDDGGSKTLKVAPGTYDIRITDDDQGVFDTYSRRNVVINSNTTITFTGADIDRENVYGTLKLTNYASGLGIYRIDILDKDGVSKKDLYWSQKTDFTYNMYYEFLKADNTPEYNFTCGTYGLRIMQYVEEDGVYITWEKRTPITINKNIQTLVTFDGGSDWKKAGVEWPSNDVWTSYGLHGFKLPAGASVINIWNYTEHYHSYSDYIYVRLDGDYSAFMNLKNQIDASSYEYDLDDGDDPGSYILRVWTSDFINFLTIDYSDSTINIEVSKTASFYGTWGKSNYGIFIDWYSDSIYFYGEGITSEPFDFFYSDGSITILNWEYNIDYFDFNISMEDDDTLTVTGMPSTGDYVLTGFNGVYERFGM